MKNCVNYLQICFVVSLAAIALFTLMNLNAQNRQEIVVVLEKSLSDEKLAEFNRGEELRKQMDFVNAISAYKNVITGDNKCGKESEAHYNIGLCYTWLGKPDSAKICFNDVINTYEDDGLAYGFAEYGLAWLEFQRKEYQKAISRLRQVLDSKKCQDKEHNAQMLFQIGRIYLSGLHDRDAANETFKTVLTEYPDTEIAGHPFLKEFSNN